MKNLVAVTALVLAACSGGAERVEGVVVAVDGGLSGVSSFQVVSTGGDRLTFEPSADLDRFVDGAPLSHLNEHLQTGSPIRVTYRSESGRLIAIEVADI